MNNMQLGRRLALGFGVVLMLTVVVTVAGFLSLQRVTESAAIVSIMDGLVSQLMEARREEKNFQLRGFAVWEGDTQNAVQKLDDIVVQIRWGIAAIRRRNQCRGSGEPGLCWIRSSSTGLHSKRTLPWNRPNDGAAGSLGACALTSSNRCRQINRKIHAAIEAKRTPPPFLIASRRPTMRRISPGGCWTCGDWKRTICCTTTPSLLARSKRSPAP